MKNVCIIAGETSGDIHGAALMREMKRLEDGLSFRGIGGSGMVKEGLDAFRHVSDMHFMGIVEVLKHLPFIKKTIRDFESLLDNWQPDLLVLIDYPGFNLKVAPLAKKRGIPVMFYISPQLWAWHKSRVNLIRKYIDRMVVLFDFERDFYRRYGVEADFVGHPLLDSVNYSDDRESFRKKHDISADRTVVGLLPGSRLQEIERMLPDMVDAAEILREKIPGIEILLACAPEMDNSLYEPYITGSGIKALKDETHDIIANSDAVVVSSGTATLETGIIGTPMLIVYKTSPMTFAIGKSLVKLKNIGLINIVAGARIVPELWQNDVTPESIAATLYQLIVDKKLAATIRESLGRAKVKLGEKGASARAAKIALELLK